MVSFHQFCMICMIICSSFWAKAQTRFSKIDSLNMELKKSASPHKKVAAYNQMAKVYAKQRDSSQTVFYVQKALQLARQNNYRKGTIDAHYWLAKLYLSLFYDSLAKVTLFKALFSAEQLQDTTEISNIYNTLGGVYKKQGHYAQALKSYQKALQLDTKLNNYSGMAVSYNNMANVYSEQGNFPMSLSHYLKALRIRERLNQEKNVGTVCNNIGLLYIDQMNYTQAEAYFRRSLEIGKKLKQKKRVASVYNHLGMLYKIQKDYPTAFRYYQQSLSIYRKLNNQYGVARLLHNIGCYYYKLKKYNVAHSQLTKALNIRRKLKSKMGMASTEMMIGKAYYGLKEYTKAVTYLDKAMKVFQETGYLDKIVASAGTLKEVYKAQGDYQKAYQVFEIYHQAKDSIINKEEVQKITRIESAFRFQQQQDSLKRQQQQKLNTLEIKRRTTRAWLYTLLLGVVGLLLGVGSLLSRQKHRYKQNAQVLELKAIQQQLLNEQLQRKEIEGQILKEQLQVDQEEQQKVRHHIEEKDHELTKQALYHIRHEQGLELTLREIRELIKTTKEVVVSNRLKEVVKRIKKELSRGESWENFTHTFEMAHPNFYKRLKQQFPDLTEYDLKLCALLRLGFESRELASILNITLDSAKKARFRLRKKMKISDQDLSDFMRNV
ncbi:tetratricopeptide repeat protein [Microscilla marina]|uniref:Tetratricopeptide repeat domain protein n=1 Tax=Microscilla marina ATCC 23134 TaxID=313606 RepID=A1ZQL4_MICM2|nr:tetratricopeptide repeat protein [Microscilla marina]EAY27386.1 tetratricopeptide repeat domain protein [Microscilla marina ATCC 23134]